MYFHRVWRDNSACDQSRSQCAESKGIIHNNSKGNIMQMEPIASVSLKKGRILRPGLISGLIVGVAGVIALTGAASAAIPGSVRPLCDDNSPLCTEINEFPNGTTSNYEGTYVGHDEPSVLFYSNVPGSGNSNTYRLVLPKDPPVHPNQAGTRGTFNFQL